MSKKRQLSEDKKIQVWEIQKGTDVVLRCYISGEIINEQTDDIEYDLIEPHVQM